jgi:hypothetical protein
LSGHPRVGWWLGQGAAGGALAGVIFSAFQTLAAYVLSGSPAMFRPMRMIGALVLGEPAIDPQYPLLTALIAGTVVHMVLSVLYGLFVGLFGFSFPALSHSLIPWLLAMAVFGVALWFANFYFFAPIAGWTWFTAAQTDAVVQVTARVFCFGIPLALYLWWALVAAKAHGTEKLD